MSSRSPYNPGLPELADLPAMEDASPEALRLKGTLSKRLPPLPGGSLQDLYGTNYRAEAQMKEAIETGIANEINKQYLKRSAAIAKAKNFAATRAAEGEAGVAYQGRKRQVRNTQRRNKGVTKYFARNVLGMGPELYR